uniref:protein-tyrosine-phosphatase n=1 Tax=Kwoniella pini CBS 10737 TaxID=1296096 RepID=A0A1B9I7I8_9TREE|nr:uncharacterized protein I206_02239 [Kwoniella pini CBS 10737]OCF51525.1 hypothetical protein I206_02239 [Kwoniella pini CBS 10737]
MTDQNTRPRPRLPGRSKSNIKDDPPFDAAKPDEKAVDDVYKQVNSTGSLELAAKALEKYTNNQKVLMNENDQDSEELGYLNKHNLQEDVIMSSDDDDDFITSPLKQNNKSDGGSGVIHIQEVVDGLWIGDLVSAMDIEGLQKRGITNILSLLRPALEFSSEFAVYPLEIDDSSDTDILTHLPSCVAWISSILELLGGVLVHCQAGMSRSATVVAAYLMREYDLDPVQAIVALRDKRPVVDPSETFWHQLGLFYNADGRVSLKDKSTRRFYMDRTASQFMNGDGGAPSIETMAKYPMTPTASNPPTPGGAHGRRKIRCKMCRRHLAVREHMMDHILDQQPVSRPRTPSIVTLPSPKLSNPPSFPTVTGERERRASVVSDVINPLTGLPGRRASHASISSMTGITTQYENSVNSKDQQQSSPGAGIPLPKRSTTTPGLSLTASSPDPNSSSGSPIPNILGRMDNNASPKPISPTIEIGSPAGGRVFQSAEQLASSLPPHLLALRMAGSGSSGLPSPIGSSPNSSPEKDIVSTSQTFPPSQQSQNVSNAARRMSMLTMTPNTPEGERRNSISENLNNGGYPILVNNKCSGYFVEPLTWMEPVLQKGEIAGKLICPNEKCGVKIGNFDWAGVQCGCKQWVTPGFCIHRSKVDEVW